MVWIVVGVSFILMFWATGAYNRMVRLRALAYLYASALAHEIDRYLDWLDALLADAPAGSAATDAGAAPSTDRIWRGVRNAVSDARICWAEFQAKPLDERAQGRMAQSLGLVDRLLELVITPNFEAATHPLRSTMHQEWALHKLQQENMSRTYNVVARACADAMGVPPEKWLAAAVRLPELHEITLHG
jgi:LemA protein